MCSGIRDAANLCWKIAVVLGSPLNSNVAQSGGGGGKRSSTSSLPLSQSVEKMSMWDDIKSMQAGTGVDRLIGSYELERSPHVKEMINHALGIYIDEIISSLFIYFY